MRSRGIAASSTWLAVAQLAPVLVNIGLTPFVIHQLGSVQYGLWLVSSGVAFLLGQIDGGVYRTALRAFNLQMGEYGGVAFRSVACFVAALTCIVTVTLGPVVFFPQVVVDFFQAPRSLRSDMRFLVAVIAAMTALSLMRTVFAAILHSRMRFGLTAAATGIGYAGYATTMVVSLRSGAGLEAVAFAYVAQTLGTSLVIVPAALRSVRRRLPAGVGVGSKRQLAATAARVQGASLMTALLQQGALLLVGRLSPSQVAGFGPGATFSQNLRMVLINALGPIQSRLGIAYGARDGLGGVQVATEVQTQWLAVLTAFFSTAIPAAYFGVNAWLPIEGNLPGEVAAILLVSYFFALVPQVALQWSLVLNRAGIEVRSTAIALLVFAGMALALLNMVGAIGVAVASVLGSVAGSWYATRAVVRVSLPLPSPWREIPWRAGGAAVLTVLGAEIVLRELTSTTWSALGSGPLGLLACAAFAAPGAIVFGVTHLGLSGTRAAVGQAWRLVKRG